MSKIVLLYILFSISSQIIAQKEIRVSLIPLDSSAAILLRDKDLSFNAKDSFEIIKGLSGFSKKWINKNHLAFSYDSIIWDSLSVKSYFFLGPAISFDSISFDSLPQNILKRFGIKSFNKKKLSYTGYLKFRENIINHYENFGYPFANVQLKNLVFDDKNLKADLMIEKNGLFRIDSILIKGKPRISRKYLLHQIGIKSNQPYDQSKIDNLGKVFDGLSFIKPIKPAEIEFTNDKADLYLYLKSNPSNFFNGMIGLASDSSSNKVKFTGDISLILQNSLKIGDKIDFFWNRYSENSQSIRLGVMVPYIFVLPLGMATKINLEKVETGYLNTELYFSINYNYFTNNGIKAFVQKRNSFVINDTANISNQSGFSSTTAGLGFFMDNTDYRLNPTKGFYLEATSGYGNTINEGLESLPLVEFGFECAFFIKIAKAFCMAFINKSAGLIGPKGFYTNQLYKIGGLNTLRGFDEQSIYASSYSVFSIEPRLIFGKNSGFFLFSDIGWYESRLIDKTLWDWPAGFGAGMNIDTKAGIFKLIYALGKEQGNPIKFSNSKVHFGFSARF